ncbi:potassium channel subfamily K member 16-like [Molossus molossus]|uniref:potassium channel subfamily K member 16-like n=1 Tax=Molossus molossus TaxID=27622 RepID=UPI0017470836|nr:potassium channel subfamily K member 16-like [Molossus molossus]
MAWRYDCREMCPNGGVLMKGVVSPVSTEPQRSVKALLQKEPPSNKFQKTIFLFAYLLYLLLGAMVLEAMEKDFDINQRKLADNTKTDFLKNRSNMTQEDVEVFVQVMTHFILIGIHPTGNTTTGLSWTYSNSFLTSIITLTTIGCGTVFPQTPSGQMFCVVFAAIGIPLTIIIFKHIGSLIFQPFEKFGNYLKHKGVSEKNLSLWKMVFFITTGSVLFLVLPPFFLMPLENWTYIEGIYYSFITISTIGLGDYTIVLRPSKQNQSITYTVLLLFWDFCGLAWIALLFNLITRFFYDMELKLSKDSTEIEVGKEEKKSDAEKQ